MELFFVYLGLSFLSSLGSRNSAIGLISEIGTVSRYYPKWYIAPARWVKNLFKIKRRLITRFIYFELFLSLFYAALCPINTLISVIVGFVSVVCVVLLMIHVALITFDTVFIAVMSHIMKKQ